MRTFSIGPCSEIGTIKSKIKDAILEGEIPNEKEPAISYMLRLGEELGLQVREFPQIVK